METLAGGLPLLSPAVPAMLALSSDNHEPLAPEPAKIVGY